MKHDVDLTHLLEALHNADVLRRSIAMGRMDLPRAAEAPEALPSNFGAAYAPAMATLTPNHAADVMAAVPAPGIDYAGMEQRIGEWLNPAPKADAAAPTPPSAEKQAHFLTYELTLSGMTEPTFPNVVQSWDAFTRAVLHELDRGEDIVRAAASGRVALYRPLIIRAWHRTQLFTQSAWLRTAVRAAGLDRVYTPDGPWAQLYPLARALHDVAHASIRAYRPYALQTIQAQERFILLAEWSLRRLWETGRPIDPADLRTFYYKVLYSENPSLVKPQHSQPWEEINEDRKAFWHRIAEAAMTHKVQ